MPTFEEVVDNLDMPNIFETRFHQIMIDEKS